MILASFTYVLNLGGSSLKQRKMELTALFQSMMVRGDFVRSTSKFKLFTRIRIQGHN